MIFVVDSHPVLQHLPFALEAQYPLSYDFYVVQKRRSENVEALKL